MKANRMGKFFIFAGLLLIAAALCLTVYNINEQNEAARSAAQALQQIVELSPRETEPTAGTVPEEPKETIFIPEYIRDPSIPMPEVEIEGQMYIGIVTVPTLEISLPVISQWSYPRLKVAPCRYRGSAYQNDLIIMAHNYASHFGTLVNLQTGDDVYFEDMEGNGFHYQVVEMETLGKTSVDDMVAGDWDLTLFTCTVGGKSRVTIRCALAED